MILPSSCDEYFNRLLIAQAQAESLTLISSDTAFQGYEVESHLSERYVWEHYQRL
jgi:PIN domain nuclease of toxin-antitoxin system